MRIKLGFKAWSTLSAMLFSVVVISGCNNDETPPAPAAGTGPVRRQAGRRSPQAEDGARRTSAGAARRTRQSQGQGYAQALIRLRRSRGWSESLLRPGEPGGRPMIGDFTPAASSPRGGSGRSRAPMRSADDSGRFAPDHGVGQHAQAVDVDGDPISRLEAEVVRRDDPGARQEDDPVGEAILPPEPVDQVLEAARHPRDARLAPVDRLAVTLDRQADADGFAWRHRRGQGDARPQAQEPS